MAFSVDDDVQVADESSDYRWMKGKVVAVSGDDHDVRLEGHGCGKTVRFLTSQLKVSMRSTSRTEGLDYTECP